MNAIHEGHYRTRLRPKGAWLPVLVRVEYSKDDEGRLADRPRLVLWLGGQRYERPHWYEWGHRLWPIGEAEYRRLSGVHTPATVAAGFNLATSPSLF
jgi:hypothetical protein